MACDTHTNGKYQGYHTQISFCVNQKRINFFASFSYLDTRNEIWILIRQGVVVREHEILSCFAFGNKFN